MHAFVFAVLLATTLSTDTPKTTVEGATFIAPAGWSIEVKGPATILTAPEGDSRIALVEQPVAPGQRGVVNPSPQRLRALLVQRLEQRRPAEHIV